VVLCQFNKLKSANVAFFKVLRMCFIGWGNVYNYHLYWPVYRLPVWS